MSKDVPIPMSKDKSEGKFLKKNNKKKQMGLLSFQKRQWLNNRRRLMKKQQFRPPMAPFTAKDNEWNDQKTRIALIIHPGKIDQDLGRTPFTPFPSPLDFRLNFDQLFEDDIFDFPRCLKHHENDDMLPKQEEQPSPEDDNVCTKLAKQFQTFETASAETFEDQLNSDETKSLEIFLDAISDTIKNFYMDVLKQISDANQDNNSGSSNSDNHDNNHNEDKNQKNEQNQEKSEKN